MEELSVIRSSGKDKDPLSVDDATFALIQTLKALTKTLEALRLEMIK
jgi:hypothetical protein